MWSSTSRYHIYTIHEVNKMSDDEVPKEEENVYTEEGRESLVENDEISPLEEGFMEGAEDGGQEGKCRLCGEPLGDAENVFEREVKGSLERFCSSDHAEKYAKEHENQ